MKDDRPSATAYVIASSTLFIARHPILGPLVPRLSAELSERFLRSRSRAGRAIARARDLGPVRALASILERLTIPGIKLHYALRKRYIEEVARGALREGFRQVVVIGAGFDTLALRLQDAAQEAKFFEIDHPATQRVKKSALENFDCHRQNLRFISLDLTRGSLETSLLLNPDYRPDAATLFIAEGLLMYLAPADVDLLLEFVRLHSGPGTKLAFTFMEMQTGDRIGFRNSSQLVDAWLRFRGETFKWGIKPGDMRTFLADRGFTVQEIATSETLRSKYLTTKRLQYFSLAEGECLCVSKRS